MRDLFFAADCQTGARRKVKDKKRIKCTAGEALDWCLANDKNEAKAEWSVDGVDCSHVFSRGSFLVNNLPISHPTLKFYKLVEEEEPIDMDWGRVDGCIHNLALLLESPKSDAYAIGFNLRILFRQFAYMLEREK